MEEGFRALALNRLMGILWLELNNACYPLDPTKEITGLKLDFIGYF